MDEFEKWVRENFVYDMRKDNGLFVSLAVRELYATWNAADRKAREECAEIARANASCEGIAESIEYQIRATIPEGPT